MTDRTPELDAAIEAAAAAIPPLNRDQIDLVARMLRPVPVPERVAS